MIAEIIGVGAALTEPDLFRENAALIQKEIERCSLKITNYSVVGTSVQRLRSAISRALGRSNVIILLGGIGAGVDDITKQIVCETLSCKLVMHSETLSRLNSAYQKAGKQMPRSITNLAMMPEKSVVFPGTRGITPGCAVSSGNQFIMMLPEAAKEFVPMIETSVVPYLAKFSDATATTRVVNVFGLSQTQVRSALSRIMSSITNPAITLQAKNAEVWVSVTARARSKTEAAAISTPVIKEILGILGEAVYGVDQANLQSVAIGVLAANRLTLGVGESGTDGLLTELLTKADTMAKSFPFSLTANSGKTKQEALDVSGKLMKKFGSISEYTAAAMAYGALIHGGTDVGLAITGPTGAKGEDSKKTRTFYFAVCDHESVWIRSINFPKNMMQNDMKYFACLAAMNLSRLYVCALPHRMEGANPVKLALSGKILNVQNMESPTIAKAVESAEKKEKKKNGFFSAVFPSRGDGAGEVVRKLVLIVAVAVFVTSAAYIGTFYYNSLSNQAMNDDFASMYTDGTDTPGKVETPTDYPSEYQKKFGKLYAINEDIAGWIKIPDTQINYPVVQYIDNDYYLRRDFYRNSNQHGVPWLEFRDKLKPQSQNYVIYGHNMTDGQMFGELMNYKAIEYAQAHPIVSFDDVYRDNEYKIFSVFTTNTLPEHGDIFYYNMMTDFASDNEFMSFVNEVRDRSFYSSNVDVKPGDQLLTLSTCSYEFKDFRTVIVARRVRDGESSNAGDVIYAWNSNIKKPAIYGNASKSTASSAQITQAQPPASSQTPASSPQTPAASSQLPQAQTSSSASSTVDNGENLAPRPVGDHVTDEQNGGDNPEEELVTTSVSTITNLSPPGISEYETITKTLSSGVVYGNGESATTLASKKNDDGEVMEPVAVPRPESSFEDTEKSTKTSNDKAKKPAKSVKLTVYLNGKRTHTTASKLVPMIVMNETSGAFAPEALKAQVVACYSYIINQNRSGLVPSFGGKKPNAAVKKACDEVLGQGIYYEGHMAFTPFYATSAGTTIASSDVWGGDYPYLIPVDSSIDTTAKNYQMQKIMSADSVAARVSKTLGVDLWEYSEEPTDWLEILNYAEGGEYVSKVRVGDKVTTGRIMRENILGLRSAAFEINYNADLEQFSFVTYGYGHGVGMSQNGANLYAKEEGWDYIQILDHYYPGTEVK